MPKLRYQENPLHSCFVYPALCKELFDAGFRAHATHQWFVYTREFILMTTAFDLDDYYAGDMKMIKETNPPDFIISAYTLKDCELHVPPFELSKSEHDIYQLCTERYFVQIGYVSEARLPDVFGRYLVNGIKAKVLDLNKLNARFHA